MLADLVQVIIMVTGVISIYFAMDEKEHYRKWACIIGLLGQPFWLYITFSSEQWGMFFVSVAATYSWGRGIKTYRLTETLFNRGRYDISQS